eukprot:scpid83297/ scgid16198/ Outer dense fiber protein 3; Outer dense fiber of sperm tails protein 3
MAEKTATARTVGGGGDTQDTTRPIIAAMERGPGPARYGLPTGVGYQGHDCSKHLNPAYTFGKRTGSLFTNDCSPGPGYFIDPKMTKKGKDGTPSYSMLGRHKDLNVFRTPAPGKYSPEKSHPPNEKHAPAYSMGSRTRYRKRDAVPAPNSYSLPKLTGDKIVNKQAASSWTMTKRSQTGGFSEDLSKTPGPGRYDTTEPSTYKRKSPHYSMQGRSYMPGDSTQKPGPGAHSPEKVVITRPKAPEVTMGIRHTEYITPLIVDVSTDI